MQLKNIKLPFSDEWYANAISEQTPFGIQAIMNRIELLEENQQEDLKLVLAIGISLAAPEKHGTATISRIATGRNAGQYKVTFKADNGEPVDPANEAYHNEKDLRKTLAKYYSTFEVK